MMTKTILTPSLKSTFEIGKAIGGWLSGREGLIFLTGDIGAGKTAISKGIVLGYGCTARVTSPTFSLVNKYDFEDKIIFHMDLYRLSDIDELYEIGFEDLVAESHPVLIEWPEILKGEGFEPLLIIDIARVTDVDKREITFSSEDTTFFAVIDTFENNDQAFSK